MAAPAAAVVQRRPWEWFYHEFGLVSVHQTGRNAYLMILARSLRMLAYGTNAVILGMFFCLSLSVSSLSLIMFVWLIDILSEKL